MTATDLSRTGEGIQEMAPRKGAGAARLSLVIALSSSPARRLGLAEALVE